MNREAIYAALFAKLSASTSFKTSSRRLMHWADVPAVEQPALFTSQKNETAAPASAVPGQPTLWTLSVDVYVYANTAGDTSKSPAEILNPLLDAVTACLAIDNVIKNKCTLGGLVEHAWIEGTIETDEGVLGDQAVAIIPISILVT